MVCRTPRMQNTVKAVFFDRDGTLIHEKPGVYLSDPAKVVLYTPVPAALKKLQRAGFLFFIVSNQSGIGRGYFTEKEVLFKLVHALRHINAVIRNFVTLFILINDIYS